MSKSRSTTAEEALKVLYLFLRSFWHSKGVNMLNEVK